ncbi:MULTISPECIES: N-acetylneuraminate epimerase [Rhizobium/Agrobacterium group]|uniref:N-acetylneuraminate epimerase n=1 Tax=Agrobacterium genomosp. 2 str. CFBP 5494 TaxID=1183436 RepID=A0A9W5B7W1_9HYPH|nr:MULTISPECIES: N-acetylneuraminate epimerase [Rhizobium/Agrobacterium group]RSC21373.1 YjhT family mutarotase [Agrobacterium sp. FDAARGOS_525]CAD7054533.1 N-acetylneuraminic acid mutarotase [Rhizobium sp. P007]CDN95456.1 N-acetylneuraminate epimerase precursor [Agrobacterium tumefaciens]CUX03218.1 N-acetylneuraminate epimerase [Agrobacterium genomosp. 2 str. CFBP 5494]
MSWNCVAKLIALSSATIALSTVTAMAGEAWPDLPVGIKNGISARVGDTAYVGLGSAGTDFYSLDLANPASGWAKRAPFTGPATNGAAVAASGGKIFVFSGNGKASADAKSPIIFDTVYAYDTASDSWSKLDTQTPAGLSGAKALPLNDGRIAIVGGYNKELFDKYLADVASIDKDKDPEGFKKLVDSYMGMAPEDYRWNTKVLSYDPEANSWGTLGDNPFLPNCDSAVVAQGVDAFMVVSGEIKPGLRTPAVKSIKVEGQQTVWKELADLPKPAADNRQEGVAGAYAGEVAGALLVAGGANFKGAQANAEAGKWFAHDGLKKDWRDEVYSFDGAGWSEVGKLPRGLAYGASFSTPDGLLLAGGEDDEGKPRSEVFLLRWAGKGVTIEN